MTDAEKAKKYDELENALIDMLEENEDTDLVDIGEFVCRFFDLH